MVVQVAELGDQEGGEHEVEGQDVFNAVGHVERGVAGGLVSSRTIGPEAERCESGPLMTPAVSSGRRVVDGYVRVGPNRWSRRGDVSGV